MQGTAPKILVVALVVLALLFVGTLFMGNGQNSGSASDLSPGWIQGIQQSLARPQLLDFSEITATTPTGCLRSSTKTLVVAVNQTCAFTLAESSTNIRRLVFKISPTGVAKLTLSQKIQGKDAIEARQILPLSRGDSDNPDHLDLYQAGGILKVTCLPGPGVSQCILGQ
ncbi:MAG: hypothetical protein J0I20_13455 [Chloroflexi bacterium]|nr:hypothetical protein [Chloroflexota bacterium]OJV92847.1 MAG: hypothetical protein BGO39_30295 [Chloroflexi bacterium 54-19]